MKLKQLKIQKIFAYCANYRDKQFKKTSVNVNNKINNSSLLRTNLKNSKGNFKDNRNILQSNQQNIY